MDNYCDFAYLYDKLTADVEYVKRADYLEDLFKNSMEYKPVLIADVGCGTGTICNILSDRGYDMIGIDSSYDMLNVAREKSQDKSILYLNQDMTEFELYGTVDVITCMLDSLNYLIEDGEIEEFFKLCHNYLNPEGLLIFDINISKKIKKKQKNGLVWLHLKGFSFIIINDVERMILWIKKRKAIKKLG